MMVDTTLLFLYVHVYDAERGVASTISCDNIYQAFPAFHPFLPCIILLVHVGWSLGTRLTCTCTLYPQITGITITYHTHQWCFPSPISFPILPTSTTRRRLEGENIVLSQQIVATVSSQEHIEREGACIMYIIMHM